MEVIYKNSRNYPNLLKELANSPEKLHLKGNYFSFCNPIAVIGSRHISQYGLRVTKELVCDLVQNNFCVVSGMAHGVDEISHKTALRFDGYTVGVLGYGFKYFNQNHEANLARLFFESKKGVIVSPFSYNTKMSKYTFINRNKIIAGISLGVIVIEAAYKSGTFHTVEASLELNRPVLCVPGSIFNKNSRGTHRLIKSGAQLVDCVEDIIINFDKRTF